MRAYPSILDLIRETRVVGIPPRFPDRARARLWAQLDLALPGGMKDRVALGIIEEAEADGRLQPGGVILESSSGTMAEGLARVGGLKGYRVIIVTDPRIDELTQAKLNALGAELEIVDHYDPQGGWQASRLRRLKEMVDAVPGAFWSCQYDNPANRGAYAHVGRDLVQALGSKIHALVGSVGSGGSLCGVGASLREQVPGLEIVAVDAVGSVLFHQPDKKRLQSGHGNSIVPGNIRYELIDEVHWVADGEAFHACRELARRGGVFGGGSTGAAWIVASWIAQQAEPDQEVVVILPDRGDRYYRTIYSDAYLEEHGLTGEVAADAPVEIEYGREVASRWSRARLPRGGRVPYFTPGARTTVEITRELGLAPAGAPG